MNKIRILISLAALLVFTAARTPGQPLDAENGVKWLTFEQAIELNKKEPRKILIDLYTDWCGWCKKMDKDTYAQAGIYQYINENFYAVKFDAEQAEDVQFNGHTFRFIPSGRNGYHELAAALTKNNLSYPMTVFMDEELRIITNLPGYQGAAFFDVVLHYFGEGKFKDTPWEEYQKQYVSKL